MTDALEPTDQCGHAAADKTGAADVVGQRTSMRLAAVHTDLSDAMVLGDGERPVCQFNLLERLW